MDCCFQQPGWEVCCATEAHGELTYPASGSCTLVGTPLHEGACEDGPPGWGDVVCCQLPDAVAATAGVASVRMATGGCEQLGGAAVAVDSCAVDLDADVCRITFAGQLGQVVVPGSVCADFGGFAEPIDSCAWPLAPPPDRCCLVPATGQVARVQAATCDLVAGAVLPDAACADGAMADVCCLVPGFADPYVAQSVVVSEAACADLHGLAAEAGFCAAPPAAGESVCCVGTYEPFYAFGGELTAGAECDPSEGDVPAPTSFCDEGGPDWGLGECCWSEETQALTLTEPPAACSDSDVGQLVSRAHCLAPHPGASVCCGLPGGEAVSLGEADCAAVGGTETMQAMCAP